MIDQSLKIRAVIKKNTAEIFYDLVPDKKRSRTIRMFLIKEYQVPPLQTVIKEFTEEQEEHQHFDVFLKEKSLTILDSTVTQLNEKLKLKGLSFTVTRSIVLQDVINQINNKHFHNPITVNKIGIKPFYIPASHKQRLSKFVSSRELTSTIEDFILEEYEGPKNSAPQAEELKRKVEKLELTQLNLEEQAIHKLDEYAEKMAHLGIKRSHILRHVITQLLEKFEKDFNVQKTVHNRLDEMVRDLKGLVSDEEIMEALAEYQIKHKTKKDD